MTTPENQRLTDSPFPPALDSSLEALLETPWRAYIALRMANRVEPSPMTADLLFDALEGRSPLPFYDGEVFRLGFSIEDDSEWSRQLVADVGQLALNLVGGSQVVLMEIVHFDDDPGPKERHLHIVE